MSAEPVRAWKSQPRFMAINGRRLFALQIVPTGPCIGAVLYLPSFAEEMNRCRSHVTSQAHALAAIGYQCLLLDPYGTGESDGEIIDGDWDTWLADSSAAAQWLVQQTGQALTLWGVRTGALLAAELAASPAVAAAGLLLWQPVLDGKVFLNQYLRLRIASQMVNDAARETTDIIRARLSAGDIVEVAGYPLTGRMADSLAARRLEDFPAIASKRIAWAEIVAKPGQPMAMPSRKLIDKLQASGAQVISQAVACPMMWQVHERVEAPALLQATLGLMSAQQGEQR